MKGKRRGDVYIGGCCCCDILVYYKYEVNI